MEYVLSTLKPEKVFYYFEEITRIPRGSGNEQQISNYLINFAKQNSLEFIQDDALNVIIKKPGTIGYETAPTVILQGHMDMVCEKNQKTIHDFEKDPIPLFIEGDFIKAKGTTLGADNGIALAYMLAILEDQEHPHPPLEILITTDEEVGMKGALALDGELLEGRILINLDTEEEGAILVSCAGGARVTAKLPLDVISNNNSYETYHLSIRGLKGGHSGIDINMGRGNANLLMGRILYDLSKIVEYDLIKIEGGSKDNAIPRESDAWISISPKDKKKLEEKINQWSSILAHEYHSIDVDIEVKANKVVLANSIRLSKTTKDKILSLLLTIPNGVQSMSPDMPNLVQSSLNLGVVRMEEKHIIFTTAIRSSVKTLKQHMINQLESLFTQLGATIDIYGDYPAWEYKEESPIREIFQKVYQDIYGKDVEVKAIHAGLECGIFAEKLTGVDMVSFGPNMWDVHTPDERVSISSTERMWNYLLAVLREIQ